MNGRPGRSRAGLDEEAALFALRDPSWRDVFCRGGFLMLVPFVGWPIVLGYRRALVDHLFGPAATPLPRFERPWRLLLFGLGAMVVIFGHLAPLYAITAAVVGSRGFVPDGEMLAAAGAFIAFPVFSPLSMPIAIGWLATDGLLHPWEAALLLAAFAATVFVVPAGFLEVSRHGTYRAAFRVDRSLARIARDPRGYLAAWRFGLGGQASAALSAVFWPWVLFHAYVATVVRFNQILVEHGDAPGSGELARPSDRKSSPVVDAAGRRVRVLALDRFRLPLPDLRRRAHTAT